MEEPEEYSVFTVASFSSYLGGNSDERCRVGKMSEDELPPGIAYGGSYALTETIP